MLLRGEYDKHGPKVNGGRSPALLLQAHRLPPLGLNRLDFARWLDQPRASADGAVAVNRWWQHYFGVGMVKTVDDFGAQGEWPSHPELLDWLATEFIRTGWDVKALQRLIVTSAAYRQSSRVTPAAGGARSGESPAGAGRVSGCRPRRCATRRSSSSALLAAKLGGPSVKPYQPAGLWKDLVESATRLRARPRAKPLPPQPVHVLEAHRRAAGHDDVRRGRARSLLPVRQSRTDTPLQALNLMNDVTYVEAARVLAQRLMTEGGRDADARLRYGFRLALGRAPSQAEQQILRDNLRFHLDYFAGKESEIDAFLSQGDSRPDPSLDRRELAAYASVASVVLNLDEMVTKQ